MRSFIRVQLLLPPISPHIGEKPFIWNDQERAFSESSFLRSHGLIHTGEEPYECHLCAKASGEDRTSVIMWEVMNGEEPLDAPSQVCAQRMQEETPCVCNQGGRSSSQKSSFSNHLESHVKIHPSPVKMVGEPSVGAPALAHTENSEWTLLSYFC